MIRTFAKSYCRLSDCTQFPLAAGFKKKPVPGVIVRFVVQPEKLLVAGVNPVPFQTSTNVPLT